MTAKRQRGRKWQMLERVATAMLHGWRVIFLGDGMATLYHDRTRWTLYIDATGAHRI